MKRDKVARVYAWHCPTTKQKTIANIITEHVSAQQCEMYCYWFFWCSKLPPSRPVSSIIPLLSSHRGWGWCKRTEHACVIQSSPPTVVLSRGVHKRNLSPVPLRLWGLISCPFKLTSTFSGLLESTRRPAPCFTAFLIKASITKSFFSTVNESKGSV